MLALVVLAWPLVLGWLRRRRGHEVGRLADPVSVLRLDDTVCAFGDRDPTQAGRYVLATGEVCVIDDLFFHLLSLPASHFSGD